MKITVIFIHENCRLSHIPTMPPIYVCLEDLIVQTKLLSEPQSVKILFWRDLELERELFIVQRAGKLYSFCNQMPCLQRS